MLLGAIGAAEFAWGVLALRGGRMTRPGLVLGGSLLAIGVSVVAGLFGSFAGIPLAAASALLLIIGFAAATVLRARSAATAAAHQPRALPPATRAHPRRAARRRGAGRGLTTPALAMTDAGEHAVPHGEMSGHGGH